MISKIVLCVVALLVAYFLYHKFGLPLIVRSRLQKQGVVFFDSPFVTEVKELVKAAKTKQHQMVFQSILEVLREKNKSRPLPLTGLCLPGKCAVMINSVDYLDDIYVKQNQYNTKQGFESMMFSLLAGNNVVFMDTFHKDYSATRKELSAAFFSAKLKKITTIIKEEVVDLIAQTQAKGVTECDCIEFWRVMQGRIFTSIAVGRGNANVMCTYEHADGRVEKLLLNDIMKYMISDTVNRVRQIFFAIFPELLPYLLTSDCKRYARNVQSVRSAIAEIIVQRKQGKTQSPIGDRDLISILMESDLYKNDHEKAISELIVFFLAGNETIRTSSVNTTCYLAQHPEAKAKFLAEITPALDRAKDDYVKGLTEDDVDTFDYVRWCWYESMRLEPPAALTSSNKFSRTVTIKGVDFTP